MVFQYSSPVFTRTELVEGLVIVRVEVPELHKAYTDCHEVGTLLVKTHPEYSTRHLVSSDLLPCLSKEVN